MARIKYNDNGTWREINVGPNAVTQPDGNAGTTDQPQAINAQTLAGMTLTQIKEMLEPVGTIFQWLPVAGAALDLSTPEKVAAYKGFGTWQQIKGRFLLGAGDTYAAGSAGGDTTHNHDLPLFSSENNTFNFSGYMPWNGWPYVSKNTFNTPNRLKIEEVHTNETHEDRLAATAPVSTLPPYLTVYIWQRIA